MKLEPIQVHIKDFQSISDINIDIGGFTVITGPSNIGKSAVIRAIGRSLTNQPVIGMVRKGSKNCTVELSSKNWGFRWEKGEQGSVNRYTIDNKIYDKTGQNQLKEVADFGFGSIDIGPDSIYPWYANQYEPIFLLNRPGAQVTDFLSSVSNLRTIQNAVVLSSRGKKQNIDQSKLYLDQIKKLRQQLESISSYADLEILMKELDDQQKSILEYENKIASGERIHSQISVTTDGITALSPVRTIMIPTDSDLNSSVSNLLRMHTLWSSIERGTTSIDRIKSIKDVVLPSTPPEIEFISKTKKFAQINELDRSVKLLEDVKSIRLADADQVNQSVQSLHQMKVICNSMLIASNRVNALKNIQSIKAPAELNIPDIKSMQDHSRSISDTSSCIDKLTSELKILKSNLDKVEKKISSIPICPTCKRPIGQHTSGKNSHQVSGTS